MKLWGIYIAIFLLSIAALLITIGVSANPEKQLLGEWNETEWKYEKADKNQQTQTLLSGSTESIKELVGNKLLIHKAENWHFYPNGVLRLSGNDTDKIVTWHIKGRGHILQLKHASNCIENYNIDVLNDTTLVLNFEADIEVRGIAKLTFNKHKKNYAEKIQ